MYLIFVSHLTCFRVCVPCANKLFTWLGVAPNNFAWQQTVLLVFSLEYWVGVQKRILLNSQVQGTAQLRHYPQSWCDAAQCKSIITNCTGHLEIPIPCWSNETMFLSLGNPSANLLEHFSLFFLVSISLGFLMFQAKQNFQRKLFLHLFPLIFCNCSMQFWFNSFLPNLFFLHLKFIGDCCWCRLYF